MKKSVATGLLLCLLNVCVFPMNYTYTWGAGTEGNADFIKEAFLERIHKEKWTPATQTLPRVTALRMRDCGRDGSTLGFACTAVLVVEANCGEEEFKAWFSSSKAFTKSEYRLLGTALGKKFLDRFHNARRQC